MYAAANLTPTPKTILVIEDDLDVRDEIVGALERAGYHVVTASNGLEALDWLSRQPVMPALVLLDWMMPVLDGMGFLNRQASNPRLASIPVVVVSAVARVARIPRLCVAEVVAKPVRLKTLVEVVDRMCGFPSGGGGGGGGEPGVQWDRMVGRRAPTDPGDAGPRATAWLRYAALH